MPHLTLFEKGSGKTHRVEGSEVMVGRDPACGICLDGDEAKTVSGRHARFFLENFKWLVEDAGSRNGTYIGTRRLEPGARHPLAVGEVVGLGMTGTQLTVQEAVGRAIAATVIEAPRPAATVVEAAPAAALQGMRAGDETRLVLRDLQSSAKQVAHGDRIRIGRSLDCLIRVDGESATSVSRVHAEVILLNGAVLLRDGGSRHGTYLNGMRLEGTVPIKTGDVIMLGPGGPEFSVEEATVATRTAVPR
jgi:pSer/pThr/pTyr-binding forkhead associated (FHA) protein